eukprot:1209511-Karenia_brevis.AAC.2
MIGCNFQWGHDCARKVLGKTSCLPTFDLVLTKLVPNPEYLGQENLVIEEDTYHELTRLPFDSEEDYFKRQAGLKAAKKLAQADADGNDEEMGGESNNEGDESEAPLSGKTLKKKFKHLVAG